MSVIEELPGIVADGVAEARRALDAPRPLVDRELVADRSDLDLRQLSRLIHGDNLDAMARLLVGDDLHEPLAGRVDLLYTDPPFASGADYRVQVTIPGDPPVTLDHPAYRDTWPDGIAGYLRMLVPRLVLMRELLADHGTLWLHLDWHVHHYVKLVLDEVFGIDRFVNEVIWRYGKMSNTSRRFPQNHDAILVYSKGPTYTFNPISGGDSEYRARFERYLDGSQVRFGRVCHSRDKLILGRIAKVRRALGRELVDDDVLFDFEHEFKTQDDVFYDISIVKGNATENQHYDTQKPQRLLERILTAGSNPGDLVADVFSGSGTTAAVAESLGRRWIAVDAGGAAMAVARRRLDGPYVFESFHEPQSLPVVASGRSGVDLVGYLGDGAPAGVDPLRLVTWWGTGSASADGVFRRSLAADTSEPELMRTLDVFGRVGAIRVR